MSIATSSTAETGPREVLPFIPADWPNRDSSRFVLSSGCRWHVQRKGNGACLVLIHGTAASTHTWRDLLPTLAERFDVVAVDLPGHGFSERLPGGSMALDDLSQALAQLLTDLGVAPRHLVGHSAGAAIALDLVLNREIQPLTVCGINAALLPFGGALKNLFSPMARFFASTQLMPRLLARRARTRNAVGRVLNGTGSALGPEGLAYYQRLFQRESHLAAVLEMMATWNLQPLVRGLPDLDVQLTLIVGSNDKAVSPREAQKIRRVLPTTVVHELDGLGHLAHEESPAQFVDMIDAITRKAA